MTQPLTPEDATAAGDLIRLSEGASLMRMHPRTLHRWIKRGRLSGWRLPSGHIYVDRAEVLNLAQPIAAEDVA